MQQLWDICCEEKMPNGASIKADGMLVILVTA